jgi:SOS response regulatory protein OraA/RecX
MSPKRNQRNSLATETDPYNLALGLALKKLRSQARFESEIRKFLAEFPEDVTERVIRFLQERRILDDSKTTQSLIDRYSGRRSVGIERIRAELTQRGAPEEMIEAALASIQADEGEGMLQALQAKFGTTVPARAKAARFLYARGFPEDEIESALDQFFQS